MLDRYEMWYWLSILTRGQSDTINILISHFKDIYGIYSAREEKLLEVLGEKSLPGIRIRRDTVRLQCEYARLSEGKIKFVLRDDEDFPKRLREIPNSPWFLFVKGELPPQACPAIGIVGSRSCSIYGSEIAASFAGELVRAGVCVISGLAEGIDGAAHRGAVASHGYTAGVLGGGIDTVYPRTNWQLFSQLEECGGIISEYPPGTRAKPFRFPLRNRIISGLSDAVLVVEARKGSGTLHTVDHALTQGRDVFVIPGRLNDPLSESCNLLLQQGARPALKAGDILSEVWGIETCEDTWKEFRARKEKLLQNGLCIEFNQRERIIYNVMSPEAKSFDRIAAETGLGVPEIAGTLFELKEKQLISEDGHGSFFLKP